MDRSAARSAIAAGSDPAPRGEGARQLSEPPQKPAGLRLFGVDVPEAGADWNIEEMTVEEVEAKARQPGGIAWMERVGVITEEGAAELRKRFPDAK